MRSADARAGRRELGFVLALAACGIAVVLLVALLPWYRPGSFGAPGGVSVVQTHLPVDLVARTG